MVAKSIAQYFQFESKFLDHYEQSAFDTLMQQEDFIRNYYPEYLEFLPLAAKLCVEDLVKNLQIDDCHDVWVVGKKQAALKFDYSEVDLIIYGQKEYQCSIKFARYSSFVNTKSAGVRSLFSQYFPFEEATSIQQDFNQFWDFEWQVFTRKMHELADLTFTRDFEEWKKYRREVLPGQLTDEFKQCLLDFYSKINARLYEILNRLLLKDRTLLIKSIPALIGFSKTDLVQICFFYNRSNDNLTPKHVDILSYDQLASMLSQDIEIVQKSNNVEVKFPQVTLQIRIKPMNTFVNKGYKFNCSVKFS